MRERVRSLGAVILCILLGLQLFGWNNMIVLAETISVTVGDETLHITSDREADVYLEAANSGIQVDEGAELKGNVTGSSGSTHRIVNDGTIKGDVYCTDGFQVYNNSEGHLCHYYINGGIIEHSGESERAVFQGPGKFTITGGWVQYIETDDINNAEIVLGGGEAYYVDSNSPITLTGNVRIRELTCGESIKGTGKASVRDELYMKYDNSNIDATISVNKDTKLQFAAGSGIKVQYQGATYTLKYDVEKSGTLATLAGNTISVDKGANIIATTTTPLNNKYLYGDTSGTIKYTAADGYYFPENYEEDIECTGAGDFKVKCTLSTVEFTYAPAIGEADETITVKLPAATQKEEQEEPARVAGGVEEITETTTAMEYAQTADAAADAWTTCLEGSTPVALGTWYVRYKETDMRRAGTAKAVVVKTKGAGSISVADIAYGETLNPVVDSDTNKEYIVEYKLRGADDSDYKLDKPTSVGKYTARVTFEENDTYISIDETDDFEITKATRGTPEGVESEGNDTLTGTTTEMEYAPTADADVWVTCSENSTSVTSGVWYVRYKENDTHFAGAPLAVRVKANGSGTLQVSDVYYGGSVKPVVNSDTNPSYTVQYKEKEATEYTSDVPVEVGEYTARVTFEENDTYLSSVVYDDFVISYLPLPDNVYTISGTIGDNGYYVSAITVVAASGYLVAETQDGNYVQSLEYSKIPETTRLFFMKQSTGEKTAGISLPEISIDQDVPVIDAIDNNVYYGNSVEVSVSDENLKGITVNGKEYKFKNNSTKLLLEAKSGISNYEIVVTDIAGNSNKIKVTVASEWTKTGIIPSKGMVRLLTNSAYKLGEGTWHVEGDSTIYSGNQTFYVRSEGEYTFNNK